MNEINETMTRNQDVHIFPFTAPNRLRFKSICQQSINLSISLLSFVPFGKPIHAADFGTGIVGVEDGDDRLRPAAVLHAASAGGFISRFYLYGRDYGPVVERNYILSLGKRFDLGSKAWQANIGFASMADVTTVKFPDTPDDDMTYTSTNFGMSFGLHWTLFELKLMQLKATWDSHVFPAGSGFIFLANARKSTLGIMGSVSF
jgi:hypothetical protein